MDAYVRLTESNRSKVDRLLADTAANGGLAPVELDRFWADQELARRDPFGAQIPQVPLGAICNWECVFDELGVEQDWWRFLHADRAWALDLSRWYNDRAEAMVGRRLLSETGPDLARQWPEIKGLHDIFEAENVWEGGANGSWWLKQVRRYPRRTVGLARSRGGASGSAARVYAAGELGD